MIKRYVLLVPMFLVFWATIVIGQTLPKREFRAVWVATVKNIDWPSKSGLSSEKQQQELISILDEHQKNNINAIFFQIRPAADALYAKSKEPWSAVLSGKQGEAPKPFYDPLDFAIKEAHKRGMELHAWLNPYRATTDSDSLSLSKNHITITHPNWVFSYEGKKYFNPALPEVRDYINEVVMNVVKQYDIDGVHFDDYFYPYPGKKQLPDSLAFIANKRGQSNIEDWRRENVDLLIKQVSESIHKTKKYVKFGVSPFGIWRNKKDDPRGSDSNGFSGYSALYADVYKWAKNGWLDYVNPQIYFPFGYAPAAYEKLTDWWAANAFGKHVYIGHGIYRLDQKLNGWDNPQQLPNQIRYLRNNKNIQGSVFFSSKSVTNNMGSFQDSLRQNLYKNTALPPTMPWIDNIPPAVPIKLTVKRGSSSVLLNWKKPLQVRDGDTAYGYVIYRTVAAHKLDINNPQQILKVVYNDSESFEDKSVERKEKYRYSITALDRMKNESGASNQVKAKTK
ncbi:glycoside hydrolase family 10 protein [Pedobacter arcticus]|uniref:glycoside hydrolase family 10 protein n=1 Tax=Pedobacter arcticus TaxID=752140 RepID=UPI0012B64C31|nr:family 10 glycosylhydrolase [Pedobacter arcticus]